MENTITVKPVLVESEQQSIVGALYSPEFKPPILYTEEEARQLVHKYESDMNYYGRDPYYRDCFPKATEEWFNENKKK